MENHPNLNMVINSAGIMQVVDFFDEDSQLTNEVEINLLGTIYMNKTFLPILKEQSVAAMVNISSGLSYVASTGNPIYSASKSGVNALTEAIRGQATYLGYDNVKMVQIAPPLISETNLQPELHDGSVNSSLDMTMSKFVSVVFRGLEKDKKIINPGLSKLLSLAGKFASVNIKEKMMRSSMAGFSKKN